jgi:dihydrofolate synthase / folylpolyglutamate synthase
VWLNDEVTIQATFEYLDHRIHSGIKFGLETIGALLAQLDHPERAAPSLLVAGTNGKGSVVAYTDAILRASGYRTARYTSPHIARINERIVVDGAEISDDDLAVAVTKVRSAVDACRAKGTIKVEPTFFETITAAAWEHFRRCKADVCVMEVGMGGRLDATNAADPIVSAIVSIAFDHEKYLGYTLAEIAGEKAGVMREGRIAVLGQLPAEARETIEKAARQTGATLVDAWDQVALVPKGDALEIRTPRRHYGLLPHLPGEHQRNNLLVALRLLEAAEAAGLRFNPAVVKHALSGVHWPGRLEWLATTPPILLDGAHNPAGAVALAQYLELRGPFVLIFGAMHDKDIREMARVLFPLADTIILSGIANPRAAQPEEIASIGHDLATQFTTATSSAEALKLAQERSGGRPIVVAGSLYLVGEIRALASSAEANSVSRGTCRPAR